MRRHISREPIDRSGTNFTAIQIRQETEYIGSRRRIYECRIQQFEQGTATLKICYDTTHDTTLRPKFDIDTTFDIDTRHFC